MKKILAMLLALTCAIGCMFALTACGDDVCEAHVDEDNNKKCDKCQADMPDVEPPKVDERPAFVTAIEATKPTQLTVTVKSNSAFGQLTSAYTTTYSSTDSSFTVAYRTEKINDGFEVEGDVIVSEGVITCDASGNYSDGGAFAGSNPAATGVKVKLTSDKLVNYTVTGDILTATIAAADTLEVLGASYGADVTLVLTKSEGKIVSVSLTYGAEENRVQISCVYN